MQTKQQTTQTISRQHSIWTVMLTWFLMHAGFFLIIPLLSVHFVDDLGWAAVIIGGVLALRQFMQQGLTMFGGALADRFGAKGLILSGLLIRSISFVLMGFARTPLTLFLAGALAALGGALFDAPLKATIAALAPPEEHAELYARIGILQNVARTVGPSLGALLISLDFLIVGLTAAGFFLLAFFVALFGLPAVAISTDRPKVTTGLHMALTDRTFVIYTALMMGFWFMWVQISIAMPLEVKNLTGNNSSVGLLFSVNAVLAIVLQVPALRLAQRFLKPFPILILGIACMAIGLGLVAWVHTITQLYLAVFFFALGTVLVMPNAQTVAASLANPAARGAYFGVNSLALACGGGLGHVVGGLLVDKAVSLNLPALPWLVFALVGTLTAISLTHFYRRYQLAQLIPAPVPVRR